MNPLEKERKILQSVKSAFEKNKQLEERFMAFLKSNQKEDAHHLGKKILYTYEILMRIEKNMEKSEDAQLKKDQEHQLYDLDLLHRAVDYLLVHPEHDSPKLERAIEDEERDFLKSVKEELYKLDRAA